MKNTIITGSDYIKKPNDPAPPTDLVTTMAVADGMVKGAERDKLNVIELEKQYRAACAWLEAATDRIKVSYVDWVEDSNKKLKEVQLWRMAIEREVTTGTRAMKDLTEFLGSPETAERLKTIRELVELSERLKVLKESGFLDSMVDTMLKVKP